MTALVWGLFVLELSEVELIGSDLMVSLHPVPQVGLGLFAGKRIPQQSLMAPCTNTASSSTAHTMLG